MTGEGFMGVTWRERRRGGIAVCSSWCVAVASDHAALIDLYDELAYRANGIEITRHEWPRFEEVESNE
jgi:hypothetical protein